MAVAQVFKALGDPVQLEIVRRLSIGADYTVGNLSKDLGLSRQGARKQIQVLVTANIVNLEPVGRETKVTLEPGSLEMARAFIADLEHQWDQCLQALKDFAES